MEEYRKVLESVAQQELIALIIWDIILLLMVCFVWISTLCYFRNEKKKKSKHFMSEKYKNQRRKSIWAAAGLTLICVVLGALLNAGTVNTMINIREDLENNTYVTYVGGFYIDKDTSYSRKMFYDRWGSVYLDDGGLVFLYQDNFMECLLSEDGRQSGTVIYGQNSMIVVAMEE